jgi:DNA topoisomerase-2
LNPHPRQAKKAPAAKKAAAKAPLGESNVNAPAPSGLTAAANGGKAIEDIYQKKTQLEHILLRPDTYVGRALLFTVPRIPF